MIIPVLSYVWQVWVCFCRQFERYQYPPYRANTTWKALKPGFLMAFLTNLFCFFGPFSPQWCKKRYGPRKFAPNHTNYILFWFAIKHDKLTTKSNTLICIRGMAMRMRNDADNAHIRAYMHKYVRNAPQLNANRCALANFGECIDTAFPEKGSAYLYIVYVPISA